MLFKGKFLPPNHQRAGMFLGLPKNCARQQDPRQHGSKQRSLRCRKAKHWKTDR
ncbi:hypothetical protein X754_12855 [Mesorhizobium sp. LNJC403B00]|nr:hypothetical protein X754_12855 [Mesorhizobium sp. LNJC403B00]